MTHTTPDSLLQKRFPVVPHPSLKGIIKPTYKSFLCLLLIFIFISFRFHPTLKVYNQRPNVWLYHIIACEWHQTRGFGCWVYFKWFIYPYWQCCLFHIFYYIITYAIPFPSKLSFLLINWFDLVGMYYINQRIQLSSVRVLSVLFFMW